MVRAGNARNKSVHLSTPQCPSGIQTPRSANYFPPLRFWAERTEREKVLSLNLETNSDAESRDGETYLITLTDKKEQSLFNELEQAISGMARHEFPPKPDVIKCPGCPFFLICPA